MLGICLGLQLALEQTEEDGGVDGPRAAARAAPSGSREGRVPRIGWADGRHRSDGVLLRALVRVPRRPRPPPGRRASSPRRGPARSSASSSTRRRAAPPARVTSKSSRRSMPLPRLIPCLDVAGGRVVKGVRFQGAARRRRSGRARRRVLGRRRRRARLPRRPGDARAARRRSSSSCAASPSGSRSRSRSAAASARPATRRRCSRRAPTRWRSTRAALERPELLVELAARLGSQAVVVAIDVERGRVRSRAGTLDDAARRRRLGARSGEAWRRRDPAHLDRRRRDARGLRPRADRRGRRRGRRAGDRVGRRGQRAATSPTRSRSRRRRCSPRSCTRIPPGSRRCGASCATSGCVVRDAA